MIDVKFPLSNLQMELMNLYSTNLSDEELQELKDLLAKFYGDKAVHGANNIWDERGLTDADMEKWLNEKS